MPKNVEDIIPKKSRSIRDIPVPEDRRHRARRATDLHPEEVAIKIHKEKPLPEEEREDKQIIREYREEETTIPRVKAPLYRETRTRSRFSAPRKTALIASLAVIAVAAFAVFSFFRSATLAYTPKSTPLNFQNESFTAYKTGGDGVLLFSVVKISDSMGVSAPASGETQVSKKASGTIVVYNNTSAAQKLIANTRFQSTDGHIYRIASAISVPAKSGSAPGSLEVTVTADQAGAEYNIGLSDFTVPGLKGDARFDTVYARSKTAMTGGLVGTERAVSPSDLAQATQNLETDLKNKLVEEAQAQVPADFILFPSLSETSFADLPQSTSTQTDMVTINEKGDFYGVIFKKSDLAEYVKEKKLSIPENQPIELADISTLALNFSGAAPSDLLGATQISFTMNGAATAVWITDEASLKRDLAGTNKGDLANVLKNYSGIASANATIRPFWKTSFPSDPSQITLKKNPLK